MASTGTVQWKHTFLIIEQKLESLDKMSGNKSGEHLARFHGVGKANISDIKIGRVYWSTNQNLTLRRAHKNLKH